MSTFNKKTTASVPASASAVGRGLGGMCMRWIAGLAALVMAVSVQAGEVNLTDISFDAQAGGTFEIRLGFDGAPPEPKGFTIEQPARISLDLDGVSSKLERRKHTVDAENARSIFVAEADGKTRIVVNLVELTSYETRADGNDLIVTIGNEGERQFLTQPKQALDGAFSDKSQVVGGKAGIADIDFQRGEKGEGQLIISLSDPKVDIDVVSEGSLIKVKFMQVNLPENLQRRFDVMDFATPVQMFDATMADGSAVIAIKPSTADYDYLAYQTDGTYVVSLKPLTPEEVESKKAEFAYVGEKISLNFQDIEVRSVLQIVADFTGLNLVASDTVGGKITLRLDEVPWDQALELILKTKGLDKRQIGNVLMVAPAAEIAERERQEIETRKQLQELAPLQTEYIRIKYAQADEIFKLFEGDDKGDDDAAGSTGSLLTERGQVVVDSRTNALLITETAERLEAIRRLINLIDVPIRQVMIEARIVIANSDFLEDIGVRWGGAIINQRPGGDTYFYSGRSDSVTDMMGDVSSGDDVEVEFPSSYMVDLAAAQESASRFAVGYLNDRFFVTAEISALESQGRGEVVSQPKVITGDKQTAIIKSGQEVPYQTSSSSGRTTVQFKEAVLKLEVRPSITPDGRLLLDLEITQDSVGDTIAGEFNSEIPLIDTNSIETQVLVDNGQTIVLGGVYRTRELENELKTPFLGDIPYIGRLFRKTFKDYQKQELLMFITPRILADSLLD